MQLNLSALDINPDNLVFTLNENSRDHLTSDEQTYNDQTAPLFLNHMLLDAVGAGASDIHFEPFADNLRIRRFLQQPALELPQGLRCRAVEVVAQAELLALIEELQHQVRPIDPARLAVTSAVQFPDQRHAVRCGQIGFVEHPLQVGVSLAIDQPVRAADADIAPVAAMHRLDDAPGCFGEVQRGNPDTQQVDVGDRGEWCRVRRHGGTLVSGNRGRKRHE